MDSHKYGLAVNESSAHEQPRRARHALPGPFGFVALNVDTDDGNRIMAIGGSIREAWNEAQSLGKENVSIYQVSRDLFSLLERDSGSRALAARVRREGRRVYQ